MKIANLSALREFIQVPDATATVSVRIIFCIPGHFVNKVTEVQHKIESFILRLCVILKDHPAVSVQGTFIWALATYKSESNRCIRILAGCSDSTTDPAGEAMLINKA